MDREIFKNTIMDVYPSYMKKDILKKLTNDGLIINEKKKRDGQVSLNFNNVPDVSGLSNIDDKMFATFDNAKVFAALEAYEYERPYRHFCYFHIEGLSPTKLESIVSEEKANLFSRQEFNSVDSFDKPTIFSKVSEGRAYFKFSKMLTANGSPTIKYVTLAIIDIENSLVEIRFDRIGVAYRNSYIFYKENIEYILRYFRKNLDIDFVDIDFKAVVEHVISKDDDATVFAQKMVRNGSTAYLEAYEDEGDEITIPILGELDGFMKEKEELFSKNEATREIKRELERFLQEIVVKSDLPKVKIILADSRIKLGITHNYKDTNYSLFMLYGELVGEELMHSVRNYLMQCYKKYEAVASTECTPTNQV